MKKILAAICVALCCICSHADTNTVDLTEIENLLSSLDTRLASIDKQTSTIVGGSTLKSYVMSIRTFTTEIAHMLTRPDNSLHTGTILDYIYNSLLSSDGKLSDVLTSLSSIGEDVSDSAVTLESCLNDLESIAFLLGDVVTLLQNIERYVSSLPRIESYQSALSVIVSNINEHILAGINVSIPNTINVDVRNFPNFNPEWDFLSRSFQWSGWGFDNTWQQFTNPSTQDNTLQGASPMSIPATTTLADYLEKLYIGINNSGRILNDSIIHACYLLEGSNIVSQAEQEEVSDSVSDSVDSADTKMEQISSSIPTPVVGVDTSYISRGISFWDQIGNIQKPPYITITTSPSDGFLSIPEIHIEVELAKYPMLDKFLEFARSVFTWLWWVLSVFFLLWLFRRAMVLYSMVMSLLGPQPTQTTAVDVV